MKFAALIAAAGVAAVAAASAPALPEPLPTTWNVRTVMVGYASEAALKRALARAPAQIVGHLPQLRAVEVAPENVSEFVTEVRTLRGIEYVERPALRRALAEPALGAAPEGGPYQWQYAATRADQVPLRVIRSSLTVTIAVVDSGADVAHPDLAAKRPSTYNAVDGTSDVRDDVGHGTFVSSLAAGSPTNNEGMAGAGGEARLLVAKAGARGGVSDFDMAAAITHAVDRGARIVNLSLGGMSYSTTERRAISYAITKDVLLVAAIGNEYERGNPVEYPAALLQPVGSNGVGGVGLSVGATTSTGARAPFSNTGTHISLAAPGLNVFAAVSRDSSPKTYPRVQLPGSVAGLYGYGSGTSYAAPQVAGAAALVWGANSLLSARQVAEVLKQTASGGGTWNAEVGYGVIDVAAAVERARTMVGVSLRVFRSGNRAYLSWRGPSTAKSYRLLVRVGDDAEKAVLQSNAFSHTFDGASGRTHVFAVEALDAAGATLVRSAPVSVTLGQTRASLVLRVFRFRERGQRRTAIVAFLEPRALDTKPGMRMVTVERLLSGHWTPAGFGFTDAAGRAGWVLPRGTHRLRARFRGSPDVAPATSRPVTVRVR